MLRLVLAFALAVTSTIGIAQEVRLGCFTDRPFLPNGAPPVLGARFNQADGTASLYASELGGSVVGQQVTFLGDHVRFNFEAKGYTGVAVIDRIDGSLTMSVPGVTSLQFTSKCRREQRRF